MTIDEKISELNRCRWRFSSFEKNFLKNLGRAKKKNLSERQAGLVGELYERMKRQMSSKKTREIHEQ